MYIEPGGRRGNAPGTPSWTPRRRRPPQFGEFLRCRGGRRAPGKSSHKSADERPGKSRRSAQENRGANAQGNRGAAPGEMEAEPVQEPGGGYPGGEPGRALPSRPPRSEPRTLFPHQRRQAASCRLAMRSRGAGGGLVVERGPAGTRIVRRASSRASRRTMRAAPTGARTGMHRGATGASAALDTTLGESRAPPARPVRRKRISGDWRKEWAARKLVGAGYVSVQEDEA